MENSHFCQKVNLSRGHNVDLMLTCVDMCLYLDKVTIDMIVLRENITPVDNFMFSGLRRKLDPCLFQQVSTGGLMSRAENDSSAPTSAFTFKILLRHQAARQL